MIIIFGFIIYSLIEGFIHGYLEHHRMTSTKPVNTNLHPFYTVSRLFVATLIFFYFYDKTNLFNSILNTISIGLLFSWFHNGMYYLTRDKLSPGVYPKRWKAKSKTSNALIELSYEERTCLLILGIIGIFIGY